MWVPGHDDSGYVRPYPYPDIHKVSSSNQALVQTRNFIFFQVAWCAWHLIFCYLLKHIPEFTVWWISISFIDIAFYSRTGGKPEHAKHRSIAESSKHQCSVYTALFEFSQFCHIYRKIVIGSKSLSHWTKVLQSLQWQMQWTRRNVVETIDEELDED